ncbi:MAG TPA: hypothetical protein DHV36_07015 [Desulfobacteraceae bacterium]|nr:hypothetical protein [Desulfobacteraceae bacterium]|tara:strand:- start:279 stop:557 length:279 start_codon:yes stop_codon:yes gene_type:complete
MRPYIFLAGIFMILAFWGCTNTEPVRDVAYFQENPKKLQTYMAVVEKNMAVLTTQVERGHITVEQFDKSQAAIMESPTYKAARKAIAIQREN